MSRKISFSKGEYYHIYNRGVDKRNIFSAKGDYDRFLALLYLCNTKEILHIPKDFSTNQSAIYSSRRPSRLVDICAYCLMPNHFHILVRESREEGISTIMQKLTTAYTMYFNTHNDRSGALFQGTFKAEHADDDNYLKYLISYIHLNPVKLIDRTWKETGISDKKRAQEFLDKYRYSSYQDFNGIQRSENTILATASLPEYFATPTSFRENIKEWLEYKAE
jgi:putative transposase